MNYKKSLVSLASNILMGIDNGVARVSHQSTGTTSFRIGLAVLEYSIVSPIAQYLQKYVTRLGSKDFVATRLQAWEQAEAYIDWVIRESKQVQSVCILLHGKPGVGKSLFASYLAKKYGFPLERFISSSDKLHSKPSSENLCEPSTNMIKIYLVDEIDRIVGRGEKDETELQNYIDDKISCMATKSIILLTTNNFEAVKHRPLCREGRIDMAIECKELTEEDRKNLCHDWNTPIQPGETAAEVANNCRKWWATKWGSKGA